MPAAGDYLIRVSGSGRISSASGTTPHKPEWLPYLFGLKPAPLQVALQMMFGYPREIEAINQGIENPRIVIDFNLDTHTITTQIAGDT